LFGARRLRMRDVGRHNLLRESLALSLGERVSRDGAFTSRRGTGEGLVPSATNLAVRG